MDVVLDYMYVVPVVLQMGVCLFVMCVAFNKPDPARLTCTINKHLGLCLCVCVHVRSTSQLIRERDITVESGVCIFDY